MILATSISDSIQQALNSLADWIPRLLGAALILIIGLFIARFLGRLVTRLLNRTPLDGLAAKNLPQNVALTAGSPSRILGKAVYWLVVLGVLSMTVDALGIVTVNNVVANIYAYVPNVIAAVLVLVIAGLLMRPLRLLIEAVMPESGARRIIATAVPYTVLAIGGFMALDQLNIAPDIVRITYMAIMGSVALGLALAFGLGGREAARELLEEPMQARRAKRSEPKAPAAS